MMNFFLSTARGAALDGFAGAAVIFALVKLMSDYAGPCIKVRRASDNALLDIGFNPDGTLDTTALLAHVGADNGFVHTWYDQSGNARHATQTTRNLQPRIVLDGVTITSAGLPAVWDVYGGYVQMSHSLAGVSRTLCYAFDVFKTSEKNNCLPFASTVANNLYYGFFSSSGPSYNTGSSNSPDAWANGSLAPDTKSSWGSGANVIASFGPVNLSVSDWDTVELRYTGNSAGNRWLLAHILYPSNQSSNREAIETLLNSYYKTY